ncbi:MAG: hypothetical protein RBU37_21630, partial [Myxococcota bacterium]|nr:hypothetical protein [Myxococcota bacterium]
PVDPEPELPEESSIDWLSIGIMGGGAAIAIAGLGVDLGSQGLIDDHKKYSSDISTGSNEERRTKVAELEDDISTRKLVSIVLYGVGGAALATGVVLFVLRSGSEQEEQASYDLLPVVDAEGAGLRFNLRF